MEAAEAVSAVDTETTNISNQNPPFRGVLIFSKNKLEWFQFVEEINMATITVVEGPMRSGKSEELISEANKYTIAGKKVLVIKPKIDTRVGSKIASRKWVGGKPVLAQEFPAFAVLDEEHLRDLIRRHRPEIIIGDECQFYDDWFLAVVYDAAKKHEVTVLLAGLGLDEWLRPFKAMPGLLAMADVVIKKTAVCSKCRCLGARFTQKLYGGSQQIEVGDALYEPRCERCHTMPQIETP